MYERLFYTIGQAVGVAVLLFGLYVLFGLGWAALIGGAVTISACVALEAATYGAPRDNKSGG